MRTWKNRSFSERAGIRLKNRKGQEEIAGFVAIVLIVSVIIVIFIGANLNNKGYDKKNILLSHYLQSLNQFTTDCSS